MTDEMMNLRALVEKAPDADLLREMIGFAAQRLMEMEVAGLTGAAYGEKSSERLLRRMFKLFEHFRAGRFDTAIRDHCASFGAIDANLLVLPTTGTYSIRYNPGGR